jgi:glucosamine-6-phosphate deaminase
MRKPSRRAPHDSIFSIPPERLGKGTRIKVEILETEDDIYHDFARVMFNEIGKNNASGRPTVFILPVGPVGQYKRLVRLCNQEGVTCANLVCINMDEYCTDDGKDWIAYGNPLSFRRYMDDQFYNLLDRDKRVKDKNKIFPDPKDLREVPQRIAELGGVDICFGGVGILGHIAFNEPPEPGERVDPNEFKRRPTRVLNLNRETRLINSVTAANGWVDAIPRKAVTVGMKEILGSRAVRIYMNRLWQPAIVRKFIHGPVTPFCPASFLQEHPDVKVIIAAYAAQVPGPKLR